MGAEIPNSKQFPQLPILWKSPGLGIPGKCGVGGEDLSNGKSLPKEQERKWELKFPIPTGAFGFQASGDHQDWEFLDLG